jgi:hypothetical protein
MNSKSEKIRRIGFDKDMENARLKRKISIYKKKLFEAHLFLKEKVRKKIKQKNILE